MGRNIFLRGQRTGIIVALLSISMGRGGEGGRGDREQGQKGRKTEKTIERWKRRGVRRRRGGGGGGGGVGFALGTRYIDRSYAMLPQWRGVPGR